MGARRTWLWFVWFGVWFGRFVDDLLPREADRREVENLFVQGQNQGCPCRVEGILAYVYLSPKYICMIKSYICRYLWRNLGNFTI